MRRVFVKNPVQVTLSKLLSNTPFDFDSKYNSGINVFDDCYDTDIDNLDCLNYYHDKYKILSINNLCFKNHELFLKSWNSNDRVRVSINGCRFPRFMECYDPRKEIPISKITNENVCSIHYKDRWKIDETPIYNDVFHCYKSELMDSESFLECIDLIAYEINNNSENAVNLYPFPLFVAAVEYNL